MGQDESDKRTRSKLSWTVLILLLALEADHALASTRVRLGTSTDFLTRVHEDDFLPAMPWGQAIMQLLGKGDPKQETSSSETGSWTGTIRLKRRTGGTSEAAADHESVLRQTAEERRAAGLDRKSGADKQVARMAGGKRTDGSMP